jgi:hypothetical protein
MNLPRPLLAEPKSQNQQYKSNRYSGFVIHPQILTPHVFKVRSNGLFLTRKTLITVLLVTIYLLTAACPGFINPRLFVAVHHIPSHGALQKNKCKPIISINLQKE